MVARACLSVDCLGFIYLIVVGDLLLVLEILIRRLSKRLKLLSLES